MSGRPGTFLSSFVGRHQEAHDVADLVRAHRLVTLLGFGGLGKTRLAFHVHDALREQFDQAWTVDLAALADTRLLGATVAAGMGVPTPATETDFDVFEAAVGTGSALLLLDNCEHLLEACAPFVAALLARCPGLHVLATSRQALGLLGETVYRLPPMEGPDAVALFADRAGSALSTWSISAQNRDAVTRLCRELEGVPLAVELAAVQIRALTPQKMLDRLSAGSGIGGELRGEPSRRTTLDACIRWSFDLCTPTEQLLWSRLSVFAGGFDLDAVQDSCVGSGITAADVVPALSGLVEKSLLVRDSDETDTRYRMLEIIRQFGTTRLVERDELHHWRRTHRDHYLHVAERFDQEWCGPGQRSWIKRLGLDHDNLRLAFEFSVSDPAEAPCVMRMCSVLEHYFASTGSGVEAVHWLQLALAHGTGTPTQRAAALRVGCFIAVLIARLDVAAEMYAELGRIVGATEDDTACAYALYAGAMVRTWERNPDAGAEMAARGALMLHALGDVAKEANLHFLRGMMLGWADHADEAGTAYQRCLDLTEPRGELWLSSYSRWGLGVDALMAGKLDDAIDLEREALEVKAMFGDQLGIGLTIEALAWVAAEQGDGTEAALLLGAADAIWAVIGMTVAAMPYLSRRREEGIATVERLLTRAGYLETVERGRQMSQADAIALALGHGKPLPDPRGLLTSRERQVAQLVATGATNRDIAERLVISIRTAESHVENILRKLKLTNRGQIEAALR